MAGLGTRERCCYSRPLARPAPARAELTAHDVPSSAGVHAQQAFHAGSQPATAQVKYRGARWERAKGAERKP